MTHVNADFIVCLALIRGLAILSFVVVLELILLVDLVFAPWLVLYVEGLG